MFVFSCEHLQAPHFSCFKTITLQENTHTHTHTHTLTLIMGSEAKTKARSTVKLPLSSVPQMLSPEPSGMLTPPLQTSASIPFGWEEKPGKPRASTALITLPLNKSLELPPRLQLMEYYSNIITKSPSFRISTKHQDTSQVFLDKRSRQKGRGIFGSWGQKKMGLKQKGSKLKLGSGGTSVNSSFHVDAYAYEHDGSYSDRKVTRGKYRRNESSSTISHANSHIWATICEGFKQAIPWKSIKSKKQALTN